MVHQRLAELAAHSGTGPAKTVFFEEGRLKAQVMGLEPGQRIPPCSMDNDVAFVVLEGEGEIIVDGKTESVGASSWIFVPKEAGTRSLAARTKMTVLAMQVK